MNVRNVATALIRALTILDIRQHVLERNPSNKVSDGRDVNIHLRKYKTI